MYFSLKISHTLQASIQFWNEANAYTVIYRKNEVLYGSSQSQRCTQLFVNRSKKKRKSLLDTLHAARFTSRDLQSTCEEKAARAVGTFVLNEASTMQQSQLHVFINSFLVAISASWKRGKLGIHYSTFSMKTGTTSIMTETKLSSCHGF